MKSTATLAALVAIAGACLACFAGCSTNFEKPSIVLDTRVLGVSVDPPEIVLPVEALESLAVIRALLKLSQDPDVELPELPPGIEIPQFPVTQVCALVSDPAASRPLAYEMKACLATATGRCDDEEKPSFAFASGEITDPDESVEAEALCASLPFDAALLDILDGEVGDDVLQGVNFLGLQIELQIAPRLGADDAVYATKRMLLTPQFPDGRVANRNPGLIGIEAELEGNGDKVMVAAGSCADGATEPVLARPGQRVTLTPVEPQDAREDYVLPTLDGGTRNFTENLSYAWFATDGSFSPETTGGPVDVLGNVPPQSTTWEAPGDVEIFADIDFWLVQRDERGGVYWQQFCVRIKE